MSVAVGPTTDLRKHLGYDPVDAMQRLERVGRNDARRSVGPRMRPSYPTVRVHCYELPAFIVERARDKGIEIE